MVNIMTQEKLKIAEIQPLMPPIIKSLSFVERRKENGNYVIVDAHPEPAISMFIIPRMVVKGFIDGDHAEPYLHYD